MQSTNVRETRAQREPRGGRGGGVGAGEGFREEVKNA